MSWDTVDALHCAEDRIGGLTAELSSLIAAVDLRLTAGVSLADDNDGAWTPLGFVVERAREVLAEGFCRCVCEDFPADPCGCPCHHDDESEDR